MRTMMLAARKKINRGPKIKFDLFTGGVLDVYQNKTITNKVVGRRRQSASHFQYQS